MSILDPIFSSLVSDRIYEIFIDESCGELVFITDMKILRRIRSGNIMIKKILNPELIVGSEVIQVEHIERINAEHKECCLEFGIVITTKCGCGTIIYRTLINNKDTMNSVDIVKYPLDCDFQKNELLRRFEKVQIG